MFDKKISTSRSEREKVAHDDLDILGENRRLKEQYFSHTINNKYFQRFNARPDQILQPLQGKRILEIGCGLGSRSIMYSRLGASVIGVDISENYIEAAKKKLQVTSNNNLFCSFRTMDCHNLTFSDNSFDVVCGDAILHHLDLEIVMKEINRVLKPGGTAIFIEPLAGNPFLKIFRFLTPKARTLDERPLTSSDLNHISESWDVRSEYYGLLCAPASAFTSLFGFLSPNNFIIAIAAEVEKLLNHFTFFHSLNQFTLLNLVKR